MSSKTLLSSILCTLILSGIIATCSSIGSSDVLQRVNAQPNPQTQATAEAAIKTVYDALVAAGLKGSLSPLISTDKGYLKVSHDSNEAIVFVIFWTPDTGAHAVTGPIMQTYKSIGWYLSDLGYPKSDEKDLAGVTNGRYIEFEKGVIALIKGKNAQAFPTAQDAVAKLGQQATKSQSLAESEIKKVSDALSAEGIKGKPIRLVDTGEGYAKVYRDDKGLTAFVIFWTPSTGAHSVRGSILQTYKSEGWHISDLGYPKSDEKDLAGVTNGRYNEFENGVIAKIKGKTAQVFPTVQDAVTKLGQGTVKSATLAEAEIKKVFDALTAAGIKGTAIRLVDTGEGYAKVYHDDKGLTVFVIFWTPNTGAHALSGPILQTYRSEGWYLSELGYPKSDEKDLAGVTNGRYIEFEKGVIAMIKGKSAQVFPTVQDAVSKLKVTQGTKP